MAAEGNHGAGASADRHQERRDSAGTHHRRYGTVADPPPGSSRRGPWPDSARGRVQQSFGQSLHRRGPLQADAPRPAAPVCHPLYRIGRGHSDRGAVAGAQRRRRSGATHVWAFAERTQPSDGTKGEVLKAGWTAFGRGGTLNPLLPKHRHSRHGGASFAQQEHLVLPGGATRSHRESDFHPQSPSCGQTRFHRPGRAIQLVPAPAPTARERTQRTSLGVSNRGDPAPGQDNCAHDLRFGIQLARRARCHQIIHYWQRALGNVERNPFIAFRFELLPPSPRLATRVRLAFHRQPAASRVV